MKILSSLLALGMSIGVAGVSLADHSACPTQEKGGMPAPPMMMKGHDACPLDESTGGGKGCALGSFIGTAMKNKEALGLTEAQTKELDQLKLECQKIAALDGAQVKVACMELAAMMSPENFKLEAAKTQLKKKMDLLASMKIKELELYQKAIAVLTPEQLKKIGALSPSASGAHDCPMPGGPTAPMHPGHQGGAQGTQHSH